MNANRANVLLSHGDTAGADRCLREALDQIEELIRGQPDDYVLLADRARLWFNLGVACLKAKRNEQARTALLEATRLGPKDAEAWHMLGLAYAVEGRRSDVIRVYEILKTISPGKAEYFFRSVVLLQ